MLKHTVLALVLFASANADAAAKRKPAQAVVEETPAEQDLAAEQETPPQPEPPYPGSENGDFAADPSMAQPHTDAEEPVRVQTETERPVRIDEDGNYYYGTKVETPKFSKRKEIAPPKGTAASGEFVYDRKPETPKFSGRPGVERPIEMLGSGEFRYQLPKGKSTKSASFRFGAMTPPSIRNKDNQLTYSDIYGSAPVPVLLIDYEFYRMFSKVGRLGIKMGSGFAAGSGAGHFRDPARATEKPDERYTFLVFPNTLTANYRFQFAEKQVLVPFVEGGGGYYTFTEIRDDGQKPKLGGTPVALVAGGVNFLMDWIDAASIRQLEADYGINHLWLTAEVRATIGLKKDLDFTNNSINAGFMMEF